MNVFDHQCLTQVTYLTGLGLIGYKVDLSENLDIYLFTFAEY